jgi:hypothetical protein
MCVSLDQPPECGDVALAIDSESRAQPRAQQRCSESESTTEPPGGAPFIRTSAASATIRALARIPDFDDLAAGNAKDLDAASSYDLPSFCVLKPFHATATLSASQTTTDESNRSTGHGQRLLEAGDRLCERQLLDLARRRVAPRRVGDEFRDQIEPPLVVQHVEIRRYDFLRRLR